MNKPRRKAIEDILSRLMDIAEELEAVRAEEEEAYDNMPESLQDSERGVAMADAIEALGEAYDSLQDMNCEIAEACGIC